MDYDPFKEIIHGRRSVRKFTEQDVKYWGNQKIVLDKKK